MRSSRAVGATATLLAVLAASGCGGGSSDGASSSGSTHSKPGIASGEPAPPQTTKSTSPSSTATSPTTKPKPTAKDTAAGAPGVPEPARQHTKSGAQAFAEYFYGRISQLYRSPKEGTVENISLPSCGFCADTTKNLKKMSANGEHFDRDQATLRTTKISLLYDGSANVFITLHQLPAKRLDSNGNVIDVTPTPTAKSVTTIQWIDKKGWRVANVRHE